MNIVREFDSTLKITGWTNFAIVQKPIYLHFCYNKKNDWQRCSNSRKYFVSFCSTSNDYDEIVVFNYHCVTWAFHFLHCIKIKFQWFVFLRPFNGEFKKKRMEWNGMNSDAFGRKIVQVIRICWYESNGVWQKLLTHFIVKL